MEHRVLHMSVHCRAGMHKSTRKSTRFPVSAPPSQDMRSVSHRATWCTTCVCAVWASAILCVVRRPLRTTGARVPHLPRFSYIYTSCAVSCAVNCVALIIYSLFNFIPRIFAILKNKNRQNVTPALKNRFRHWLNAKHITAFLYNSGRAGRK